MTLTQRLSDATEGTRELDWGFRNAIGDDFLPFYPSSRDWITLIDGEAIGVERRGLGGSTADRYCPNYTASLDAALALAERLHPCWSWSVGRNVHSQYWLAYALGLDDDRAAIQMTTATAKTAPLAICLAILSAKATEAA